MKKNIKYIFIALSLLVTANSCDWLDQVPEDEITLEMVFNDKTRTEDWLAGIYAGIADPYWDYIKFAGYDAMSDDCTLPYAWTTFGWNILNMVAGNWSPASEWQMYYWTELPKYIRSAYIFIDNVKPIKGTSQNASEVELMKHEAKFMIAYYYWLLLESYGAIPFKPGLVPSDASYDDLMLEQTPFDDVVNEIEQMLLEAAGPLPEFYVNNNKFGRVTKVMCYAVRARMLLFAASPLVNGNEDYKDYRNKSGKNLFDPVYSAEKWARAATACKELIDMAETSGYALYTETNEDGTIDPFRSYQNMMFKRWNDGNKEILFARPGGCDLWNYEKHAQPRGSGGNGALGVSQSLVDAFFMKNGLSIDDPMSGYVEDGFSTSSDIRSGTTWSQNSPDNIAGEVTTAGTYNMYCNREPRFYVSVLYNDCWYRQSSRKTEYHNHSMDGGGYDSPQAGYLIRKKVSPDVHVMNNTYVYRPGIIYRLGEAYLNYAEALNESDPGNPDVLYYLNKIRERAGVPLYGSGANEIKVNASDKEAMRELIKKERRVELCVEGIRYNDLRRWKDAETVLSGPVEGMNVSATTKNYFFKRTTLDITRGYRKAFYFQPIPADEVDKNPNLVQNPFWASNE